MIEGIGLALKKRGYHRQMNLHALRGSYECPTNVRFAPESGHP
jgi:hypothetical protein